MADDSEIVNRAMRLLREAADVLGQTNINVDTSTSQSTSITTSNTRPSTNYYTSTSTALTSPHRAYCNCWTGLDWTGLDWTGLDWTELN